MSYNNFKIYMKHFGAVEGVTGSCILLTIKYKKKETNILIDNGLYQEKEREYKNYTLPEGLDISKLDATVITHVHADHIGLIPMLEANGFNGKVYMSPESLKLTKIQLESSLAVMERQQKSYKKKLKNLKKRVENEYKEKKKEKGYGKKDIKKGKAKIKRKIEELRAKEKICDTLNYGLDVENAPYSIEDVEKIMNKCTKIPFNMIHRLFPNVELINISNSHIFGSGSWFFKITDPETNESKNIVFSGDLGRDDGLIYNPKEYINQNREMIVVMEATYGNKSHTQTMQEAEEELLDQIVDTIKKKGKVIIPAFCLDRTQLLIYILNKAKTRQDEIGEIIRNTPIIIDSPTSAQYSECYSEEYKNSQFKPMDKNLFDTKGIRKIRTYDEHLTVMKDTTPSITLTASGMGDFARAKDYIVNCIDNPKYKFIFPGYLSKPSLGYKVLNALSNTMLKLGDNEKCKKASIIQIKGFSSHEDQKGLLKWQEQFKKRTCVIINHRRKRC